MLEKMKVFILISTLNLVLGLDLPFYLEDHLNKLSPNYTNQLNPWIYSVGQLKANISSLQYIIGFFRHGNRSPGETYKNDKYPFNNTKFWPEGPKELTKVGKNQLYQLGRTLRERYAGFLSENYVPQEIDIKSNIVARDFMSAATLLAGLYPPQDYQKWNPNINWQPIPIWEQPIDLSKVTTNSKICPSFYKEMMEIVNALNNYQDQYQATLDYLNKHTGLNVTVLSDIYRFWEIFDLQADNGFELPDWTSTVYPEELANLQATSMAALTSATPRMIKLLTGPVISDIDNQLRSKVNGNKKRVHLEAVHETTINAILPAFGFKKPFIVSPSAAFILELHKNEGQYFVELVYFKNGKVRNPEILSIGDCMYSCPLEQILKHFDGIKTEDWEAECKIETSTNYFM